MLDPDRLEHLLYVMQMVGAELDANGFNTQLLHNS